MASPLEWPVMPNAEDFLIDNQMWNKEESSGWNSTPHTQRTSFHNLASNTDTSWSTSPWQYLVSLTKYTKAWEQNRRKVPQLPKLVQNRCIIALDPRHLFACFLEWRNSLKRPVMRNYHISDQYTFSSVHHWWQNIWRVFKSSSNISISFTLNSSATAADL